VPRHQGGRDALHAAGGQSSHFSHRSGVRLGEHAEWRQIQTGVVWIS
jgi:hypothetical protein